MGGVRLLEVDLHVVEVIAGVHQDLFAVVGGEVAADFAGDAGDEGARRNDGVLGDDGAGGDDGAFTDARVVEDGGADADEADVFDDAAVNGGVVADGDPVADEDGIFVAHAVEDGAVLHVGVGADADGVDVAADDGVHPDAGVLAEGDIADDLRREVDIAGGGDGGRVALVGADHGDSLAFVTIEAHNQNLVFIPIKVFTEMDVEPTLVITGSYLNEDGSQRYEPLAVSRNERNAFHVK